MAAKRHYVYSTISTDVEYIGWIKGASEAQEKGHSVIVKGGANVATKNFLTPSGIMTPMDDEEITFLRSNSTFQQHMKNGFITIETRKTDPEKVAANMTTRDESAPLTPNDFRKKDAQPESNSKVHDEAD